VNVSSDTRETVLVADDDPDIQSCEVTRSLRAHAQTAEMPVILLTARVQDGDVARGMEAGATDFVKKPFSPQELGARVSSILG
jgi:DNA-binding response OmpR family regulator